MSKTKSDSKSPPMGDKDSSGKKVKSPSLHRKSDKQSPSPDGSSCKDSKSISPTSSSADVTSKVSSSPNSSGIKKSKSSEADLSSSPAQSSSSDSKSKVPSSPPNGVNQSTSAESTRNDAKLSKFFGESIAFEEEAARVTFAPQPSHVRNSKLMKQFGEIVPLVVKEGEHQPSSSSIGSEKLNRDKSTMKTGEDGSSSSSGKRKTGDSSLSDHDKSNGQHSAIYGEEDEEMDDDTKNAIAVQQAAKRNLRMQKFFGQTIDFDSEFHKLVTARESKASVQTSTVDVLKIHKFFGHNMEIAKQDLSTIMLIRKNDANRKASAVSFKDDSKLKSQLEKSRTSSTQSISPAQKRRRLSFSDSVDYTTQQEQEHQKSGKKKKHYHHTQINDSKSSTTELDDVQTTSPSKQSTKNSSSEIKIPTTTTIPSSNDDVSNSSNNKDLVKDLQNPTEHNPDPPQQKPHHHGDEHHSPDDPLHSTKGGPRSKEGDADESSESNDTDLTIHKDGDHVDDSISSNHNESTDLVPSKSRSNPQIGDGSKKESSVTRDDSSSSLSHSTGKPEKNSSKKDVAHQFKSATLSASSEIELEMEPSPSSLDGAHKRGDTKASSDPSIPLDELTLHDEMVMQTARTRKIRKIFGDVPNHQSPSDTSPLLIPTSSGSAIAQSVKVSLHSSQSSNPTSSPKSGRKSKRRSR